MIRSLVFASACVAAAVSCPAATLHTLAPTNVTATSATFNGTAAATGDLEYPQCIVRTASGSFYSVFGVTPASISGTESVTLLGSHTNLQPDTTYLVQMKSTRASDGAVSFGEEITFTTPRLMLPPTVAAFSDLFGLRPTSVTATGSVSTGTDTTSVFWDIGLTPSYGQTIVGDPATEPGNLSTSVSISFTGLQPSTTYHYRIRATNIAGTATGPDHVFTTTAGPLVSTLAATNVSDLTVTLNGSVTPDNRQAIVSFDLGTTTTYDFFPPWSKGYATPSVVSGATAVAVSKNVSGLQPSTTYHYRVRVEIGSTETYLGPDLTFTTGAPSTPPSASGAGANSVSSTGATLSVSVSAGAAAATAVFEFGTDTTYSMPGAPAVFSYFDFSLNQLVTMGTLPPGGSASASASFAGLTPSTTYHYRLKITSSLGTAFSADASFSTAPPPTVTTGSADAWQPTASLVRGSLNPQGVSLTRSFEYGTTTTYGASVAAQPAGLIVIGGGPQVLAAVLVGLTPSTTYHYRLVATDSFGVTFYGSDATFATPATLREGWRLRHFNSTANTGAAADDANPSGDGISNLMKYALGMTPTITGSAPRPVMQSFNDGDALSITFIHDASLTDLTYEVQAADDLAGPWTTLASTSVVPLPDPLSGPLSGGALAGPGLISDVPQIVFTVGPSLPAGPRIATVRDTVTTLAAQRRFMRLRVSTP
ncbi:MAG: hypothetical protein K1X78_11465 [Verrucomicrobiaceae bacterium]|nr:hypothetical protein [Verrucomicrobiaceae bacterium]